MSHLLFCWVHNGGEEQGIECGSNRKAIGGKEGQKGSNKDKNEYVRKELTPRTFLKTDTGSEEIRARKTNDILYRRTTKIYSFHFIVHLEFSLLSSPPTNSSFEKKRTRNMTLRTNVMLFYNSSVFHKNKRNKQSPNNNDLSGLWIFTDLFERNFSLKYRCLTIISDYTSLQAG